MKNSEVNDELRALALNISTQVMQLVHIILLFMTLSMVLEMIQTYSKAVHRYVNVLQKNIKNFIPIVSIFILFNVVIGSSFVWNLKQIKELAPRTADRDLPAEYVSPRSSLTWDEVGDFQKSMRVLIGGLMYEIIHQ